MVKSKVTARIAIIGGGASGLFLAQDLKRGRKDYQVTLFETSDRLGRKIDTSGNGRGNLSNVKVTHLQYNHPEFVKPILQSFSSKDFLNYANELGLLTIIDDEGRIYPRAEKAKVWTSLLEEEVKKLGVEIRLNTPATNIQPFGKSRFKINNEIFDYVIIATGSPAGVKYKGKIENNQALFNNLKIPLTPLYPTLSALGVKEKVKKISGVRAKGKVELWINDKCIYKTKGEIQFRDDSLSGIAIFECSSILTWEYRKNPHIDAKIIIDLLPEINLTELRKNLGLRFKALIDNRTDHILRGMFTEELSRYLIERANADIKALPKTIKELTFNVDLNYHPDNNQVMSGGVDLNAVKPMTLTSKKYPHLYIIGEALDIDGLCGGYNLHFAWASAHLVSKHLQSREPLPNLVENKAFVRYTS